MLGDHANQCAGEIKEHLLWAPVYAREAKSEWGELRIICSDSW